jgi:hypothetical protein
MPNHDNPPWLPLTPQHGIQRQRYSTATTVALAIALALLAGLILGVLVW